MKFNPIAILTVSLCVGFSTLPADAQWVGPRGGTSYGTIKSMPNAEGGSTIRHRGIILGPSGGSGASQGMIQTDGQGHATYQGAGVAVGPEGQKVTGTTNGSASYNPETGYSGQGTTTINGQPYTTTTSRGTTSVTNSAGETKTYTRRRFR